MIGTAVSATKCILLMHSRVWLNAAISHMQGALHLIYGLHLLNPSSGTGTKQPPETKNVSSLARYFPST